MNELERLVDRFNAYATLKGWVFAHDFLMGINQKENEGNTPNKEQIFLQLFEPSPSPSSEDVIVEFDTFVIDFFIGNVSQIGDVYYEQNKGIKNSQYRFDKSFAPLYGEVKTFVNTLHLCKDQEINFVINSMEQKQNYQDANLDGWLVNATVKVYL